MSYTFDDNLVSDLYKDAKGFRPSEVFYNIWNNSSKDEKQAMWETLLDDLDDKFAEDKFQEDVAIKSFENQVRVMLESGATDRTQAIRWIVDSLELTDTDKLYEGEYVCYKLGLPYSYAEQFNGLFEQLGDNYVY